LKLLPNGLRQPIGVFPILGGRLLKLGSIGLNTDETEVSNPWREAIEDKRTRPNFAN